MLSQAFANARRQSMAKSYSRKVQVAARYVTTPRNVERMVADGRIPKAAFYNGRCPLWDNDELDAADRAAVLAHVSARQNVA
jgi:hypothetical protein